MLRRGWLDNGRRIGTAQWIFREQQPADEDPQGHFHPIELRIIQVNILPHPNMKNDDCSMEQRSRHDGPRSGVEPAEG